jgi:transcriptional regulator with XRE-family HTH domain
MGTERAKGFGSRVAERREKLGFSQKTLAQAVGMKQQGIANIESGLVERPRRQQELAEALQTTLKWLFDGTGPEEILTPNAAEQIASMAKSIHKERLGVVIQLLRRLTESESEVA